MALVELELSVGPEIAGVNLGDVVVPNDPAASSTPALGAVVGFVGADPKPSADTDLYLLFGLSPIPSGATTVRAKLRFKNSAAGLGEWTTAKLRLGIPAPDGLWDAPLADGWNLYAEDGDFPFPTADDSDAILAGRLQGDAFIGEPITHPKFSNDQVVEIGDPDYSPDYELHATSNLLASAIDASRALGWSELPIVLDPYQSTPGSVSGFFAHLEDHATEDGFRLVLEYDTNPPTITSSPPLTGTDGHLYSYTVTATDPTDQAITYLLTTSPAGAALNPTTGELFWPATMAGNYQFQVLALDEDGFSDSQKWIVVVSGVGCVEGVASLAPIVQGAAELALAVSGAAALSPAVAATGELEELVEDAGAELAPLVQGKEEICRGS